MHTTQAYHSIRNATFTEKARLFSHDLLKICRYLTQYEQSEVIFTKKLYSSLSSNSKLLEDFLDFHGAKNNKNWYYYRELSAMMIHLSMAAYSQRHISHRFVFYALPHTLDFETHGLETIEFINRCLLTIAPRMLEEAQRLDIPIPANSDNYSPVDFPETTTAEMLTYDINDNDKDQQQRSIVNISSGFLHLAASFDQFGFYEPHNLKTILAIVPDRINEVEIRRFEMLVHNLQSSFDTYVIHGGYLFGNRKLKQLRGFFSVVFHLLQMIGRLLHLYERHLHEAGYKNTYKMVRDRMATLVDPNILLDRIINYGLFYICHFLNTGKKSAQEILNENIERTSITVGVPETLGFHSRPSLLVAKIVQHYGGQVEMIVGADRFDASSVLDIQWAGGKVNKEKLKQVTFEGDIRALKDIAILARVNYGEDTMGKGIPLPNELKYLR